MSIYPGINSRTQKADSLSVQKVGKLSNESDTCESCSIIEQHGSNNFWNEDSKGSASFTQNRYKGHSTVFGGIYAVQDCGDQQRQSTEWLDVNNLWSLELHQDKGKEQGNAFDDGSIDEYDIYNGDPLSVIKPYATESWGDVESESMFNTDDKSRQWYGDAKNPQGSPPRDKNLQCAYRSSPVCIEKLNFSANNGKDGNSSQMNVFQIPLSSAQTAQNDHLDSVVEKQAIPDTHSTKVKEVLQDLCSKSFSAEMSDSVPSLQKISSNLDQDNAIESTQNISICSHLPTLAPTTSYCAMRSHVLPNSAELLNSSQPQICCPKLDLRQDANSNSSSLNFTPKQLFSLPQLVISSDPGNGDNGDLDWFMGLLDKILTSDATHSGPSIQRAIQQLLVNLGNLGVPDEFIKSIDVKVKSWEPKPSLFSVEESVGPLSISPNNPLSVNDKMIENIPACAINECSALQVSSSDLLATPIESPPNGVPSFNMAISTNSNLLTAIDYGPPDTTCANSCASHNERGYKHCSQKCVQSFDSHNAYYCFPSQGEFISGDNAVASQVSVFRKDPTQKFPSPLKTPTGSSTQLNPNVAISTQLLRQENRSGNTFRSQEVLHISNVDGINAQRSPSGNNQYYIVYPEISLDRKPRKVDLC